MRWCVDIHLCTQKPVITWRGGGAKAGGERVAESTGCVGLQEWKMALFPFILCTISFLCRFISCLLSLSHLLEATILMCIIVLQAL
jgi:hypothetical protein